MKDYLSEGTSLHQILMDRQSCLMVTYHYYQVNPCKWKCKSSDVHYVIGIQLSSLALKIDVKMIRFQENKIETSPGNKENQDKNENDEERGADRSDGGQGASFGFVLANRQRDHRRRRIQFDQDQRTRVSRRN